MWYFPVDSPDYVTLKESLEKLALNDSSFTYEPETSGALGLGFRCGFLGLLHMNIIQERLEREFQLNLISTAPSVSYRVLLTSGEDIEVDNPSELPSMTEIQEIREPMVALSVHVPNEFVGAIIKLCEERRGRQNEIRYITEDRVQVMYDLPLSEMVFDFYDKLKGQSKGYASMDYEFKDYEASDLVKVDVLLNNEKVDALSLICHRSTSYFKGRDLTQKLQKIINRQQFDIAIQAAIGAKKLLQEKLLKAFVKMFLRSVMVVTYPEKENFLKNKKPVKNG